MGLFSRKTPAPRPTAHPVSAFWAWWGAEGHRLSPHEASAATEELGRLIAAIHPDLTWHFGPGEQAEYRLTVSAGGTAEGRPSAERWFRAAPAADATWEFRPRQDADPDALGQRLQIAGASVELAATVFAVEEDDRGSRLHVGVHHPAFADLPDQVRGQITFLVLDWLLGEDDVTRWLGRIDPLLRRPQASMTADGLRAAVTTLAGRNNPGEWALAQWEADGRPGLASYRLWAHWLDDPLLDRYHALTVPYEAQSNGLPVDAAALAVLGDVEEGVTSLLGTRGVLVGHQSYGGVRTFHVYTDGSDQNAEADLARWAADRGIERVSADDPGWSRARHLLG